MSIPFENAGPLPSCEQPPRHHSVAQPSPSDRSVVHATRRIVRVMSVVNVRRCTSPIELCDEMTARNARVNSASGISIVPPTFSAATCVRNVSMFSGIRLVDFVFTRLVSVLRASFHQSPAVRLTSSRVYFASILSAVPEGTGFDYSIGFTLRSESRGAAGGRRR